MRNKFHKNIKKFILNDTKSATTRRGGGIFLINPSVKPIGLPAPFTREPYRKRFGKRGVLHKEECAPQSEPFLLYIYANGNSTLALNKSPSIDNSSSPFCTLQSSFAIDKPKPLPSAVRDLSPRTKRSVSSSGVISRG